MLEKFEKHLHEKKFEKHLYEENFEKHLHEKKFERIYMRRVIWEYQTGLQTAWNLKKKQFI